MLQEEFFLTLSRSWSYLSLNILGWARAYLMLNEIKASANAGIELLHRVAEAQAPHILTRAEKHLLKLEEAGYAERGSATILPRTG
jgi:hypothetical protein